MDKREALIADIMHRLQEKTTHSTTVYRAEPILFTAAQMGSYLPEIYRDMKQIAAREPHLNEAALFVRQARFMEAHEDNCPYTDPFTMYPNTYRRLTDRQLRGYFSWRTKVRRGAFEPMPLPYAFLYIQETLALVGVPDAKAAYDTLLIFLEQYREAYPVIEGYLTTWLDDLRLAYRLDRPFLTTSSRRPCDPALTVLTAAEDYDDEAIYAALCTVSLFRPRPHHESIKPAAAFAAARAWSGLCEHIRRRCKTPLTVKLFGSGTTTYHPLFITAVWQPPEDLPCPDVEIEATPFCRYVCRDGLWSMVTACGNSTSKDITRLLRFIEAALYDDEQAMNNARCPQYLQKLALDGIAQFRKREAARERAVLRLNRNSFTTIRDRAAVTRDRLLTEEERAADPPPTPASEPAPSAPSTSGDEALSPAQNALLRRLLDGGDAVAYAKANRLLLSVEIEAINDRFFDDFGDTVIEWDGDVPTIVADYLEDLKGRICS